MWTRRQQIALLLVLIASILLIFHVSPQLVEHATSKASVYVPWSRGAWPASKSGHLSTSPLGIDQYWNEHWDEDGDGDDGEGRVEKEYENAPIRETELLLRPSGFSVYDRLYVWNGTLYAVTQNPNAYPELKHLISKGISSDLGNTDPTSEEMQIITPAEAERILGETAVVIEGMTFIFYDSTQFMVHYYHWWGEIMLGAMRVYAALSLLPGINTPLPQPARFLLPNVQDHDWRDYAGVDGPLMRAAFPSSSIERADFWFDLMDLNRTFVFERAMIVDRQAAHKHPLSSVLHKMIASTMNITAPTHFWEPLRKRILRNSVGYLPILGPATGAANSPSAKGKAKANTESDAETNKSTWILPPIVLYISRQGGGRRLRTEDHIGLVAALKALEDEGLCEVRVVLMEQLTFAQQVEEAGRSTIMVGVHGNGLTHQLWMPPSPRSTVIEVFFPKTYLHDYEILARNMGHKHYGVWNDSTLTYPEGQWFNGVQHGAREDLHGDSIPVHGPTVAQVIRERLTEQIP